MTSSDPEPLLVEQRIEDGEDLFVRRVTTDGSIWSRSSLMRPDEEGWPAETGMPEWEQEGVVPADALERLRAAIDRSGFFALPGELEPDGAVFGAPEHVWTAVLDDRTHTVRVRAAGVTRAPAIDALSEAVVDAMAAADDR